MSSALGYGNVTGRFFILEVAGCIGNLPPKAPSSGGVLFLRRPEGALRRRAEPSFHSCIIGGLAIAMACQPGKIRKRPGLAKVEEDVGCARLHSCGRVLFLFYGKDTIER